jgi:voltage-gated potassium channel
MTHNNNNQPHTDKVLKEERWGLLDEVNTLLDKPFIALSFAWLILIIIDFTEGLSPTLWAISNIIWGLFIFDFVLELWIAPNRLEYLKRNWLTAISIVLPALRILRLFRALKILSLTRFGRSVNLMRLLTSIRRGMSAINKTLHRRGFGYVVALTTIVIFAGAAGMAHFESTDAVIKAGYPDTTGLRGYGDALWWTAMAMTTMGSEYWPKTVEGRLLGWLLSLYAFTVFGYITATLASHFIQADKRNSEEA